MPFVATDVENMPVTLDELGLTPRVSGLFERHREAGRVLGRVVRLDRGYPLVALGGGRAVRAEHATELVKTADSLSAVGDWVVLTTPAGHEMAIIEAVLDRTGCFSRRDPGEHTAAQVVAANVDVVFVVQSLSGRSVNTRRLERELVLAWESGARPVVVLTKADLAEDVDAVLAEVAEVAPGVEVVVESAVSGQGLDRIAELIPRGATAVLFGGSGVGKSTLVNRLVGREVQLTGETRERDDKGRHTTVAREMVFLEGGGVIIDTPGLRGLALWDAEDGVASAFSDVEGFAGACRFRDCTHTDEPGCAVLAAVEAGELSRRRLESYRMLVAELGELSRRRDVRARIEKKRDVKREQSARNRYNRHSPKRGESG